MAEVAGITVGGGVPTDTTPGHAGNILPGDVLNYDFTVTNIGNAPTPFALPGAATLTGPGTAENLQYSTDGGAHFTNIPASGVTTSAIAANAAVIVRVPVTVSAGATTGDVIKVQLGDTGSNDNSAGTQNQADPSPAAADVHTTSTTAQNGLREAAYYGNGTIGSQAQAFAMLLLTRTGATQGATPAQNTLTYALGLNVASAVPTGSGASHALTAADFVGTALTVNGAATTQILLSDAIPVGTTLTGTPAAPSGWTVVYTTTPASTSANSAAWTTTAPTDLSAVTRIGFISAGTVAKGVSLTGFSYVVTTTGASPNAPTAINSIAQAFGQTAGDTANALVYDESGDQSPSNFNDDGSRGSSVPTSGTANPASDGTNAADSDAGQFYPPGTSAPAAANPPGFAAPLPAASNANGVLTVTLAPSPATLPPATGPGTPTGSYGFFRFRVRVN